MLNRLLYLLKLQNKTLGNGTKNAGEVRETYQSEKVGTMKIVKPVMMNSHIHNWQMMRALL